VASGVGDYDQCSNDVGFGYSDGCHWVNGDLNKNNSTFTEGDSTPQRVLLTGMTTGQHTITFQYDTTKGGAHAYDFLTTYNASETWMTQADICATFASSFA